MNACGFRMSWTFRVIHFRCFVLSSLFTNLYSGIFTQNKSTSDYQIALLRNMRKSLEEEAISQARPHRSLTTYNAPSSVSLFANPTGGVNSASSITKYGYLYHRTSTGKPARVVWTRRWFFIEDGWFGSHTVSTVGKLKGCIISSERIGVLLCDVKQNTEQDRRFCFEVVSVKPQ